MYVATELLHGLKEMGETGSEESSFDEVSEGQFLHLETDKQNIEEIFVQFKESVEIKDRTYRMRTFKKCFIGSEAVDWILYHTSALTRSEAVVLGREMVGRYRGSRHR